MKMFSLIVTNGHLLVIFFNFVANKRKRIVTLKTFQRFRVFPCDMWKWKTLFSIDYALKLDTISEIPYSKWIK